MLTSIKPLANNDNVHQAFPCPLIAISMNSACHFQTSQEAYLGQILLQAFLLRQNVSNKSNLTQTLFTPQACPVLEACPPCFSEVENLTRSSRSAFPLLHSTKMEQVTLLAVLLNLFLPIVNVAYIRVSEKQ